MMRFAVLAAPYYESVEVVEMHHPTGRRPSGPPGVWRSLIAAARREAGLGPVPDATSTALDGACGADVEGIHVHGLRIRGMVAHQEVLLGGVGRRSRSGTTRWTGRRSPRGPDGLRAVADHPRPDGGAGALPRARRPTARPPVTRLADLHGFVHCTDRR